MNPMVAYVNHVTDEIIEHSAEQQTRRAHAPTYTAGERAELISNHIPLVRYVANSVRHYASISAIVDVDDVLGYGAEGLIKAADTYNPVYNVKFASWAAMHIRTTIQDALRGLDPLPRSLRAKGKEIERVSFDLANRAGYWPKEDAVAAELGLPLVKIRNTMQQLSQTVVSIEKSNEAYGEESSLALVDVIADHDPQVDPETCVERGELYALLRDELTKLPERKADILRMYYAEGKSQSEIADQLGVTQSRVSQLHRAALKALRASMTAALSDEPDSPVAA